MPTEYRDVIDQTFSAPGQYGDIERRRTVTRRMLPDGRLEIVERHGVQRVAEQSPHGGTYWKPRGQVILTPGHDGSLLERRRRRNAWFSRTLWREDVEAILAGTDQIQRVQWGEPVGLELYRTFLPGLRTFREAHPILFEVPGVFESSFLYDRFDSDLRRAYTDAPDIATVVRRAFGVRAYRRDLVKEVASVTPGVQVVGWAFRGLVPIDWIIDFYRRHEQSNDPWAYGSTRTLRHLVRAMSERQRRRFIQGNAGDLASLSHLPDLPTHLVTIDRDCDSAHDAAMALFRIEREYREHQADLIKIARNRASGTGATTLADLADERAGRIAAAEMRDAEARAEREAERVELLKRQSENIAADHRWLSGTTEGGLTVTVARTRDELIEWERKDAMNNCMGSYLPGHFNILALVTRPGQRRPVAGILVEGLYRDRDVEPVVTFAGTLTQLLGPANSRVAEPDRLDIVDYLTTRNVTVTEGGYWGSPELEMPRWAAA